MKKTVSLKKLLTVAFILTSTFSVIFSTAILSNFMTSDFRNNLSAFRSDFYNHSSQLELMMRINALRAVLIAIVISIIISSIIARFVSKDINNSVKLAKDMQIKEFQRPESTRITEVNSLNESLEELDNRINLKNQYRKEIYDQLHHQSRTPLTILKNHLEGIEDGVIKADNEELNTCLVQVDNLTKLIDDMKLMIEANKLDTIINMEEYNFKDIMNTVVNGLCQQFKAKEIKLELLNNDNYIIMVDKYKFSQVLYNLLNNAYKYTKKDGEVTINYYEEDGYLVIKIKDNGIGINEYDKKHVFDAYYRSTSVSDIKGEGIGLYLVKENLKLMSGSITLESSLNNGSVFKISIPLSK
jgi:signal transduction histidine kinase